MLNLTDIRNQLLSYWSTNYNSTPTLYENSTLPDQLKVNPFVVFEIEFIRPRTVGNGVNGSAVTRHRGFVAVTLYVPKGSGNKTSYSLSDTILGLLSHKRLNGLTLDSGYVENSGYDEEYYKTTIFVPFTATVN